MTKLPLLVLMHSTLIASGFQTPQRSNPRILSENRGDGGFSAFALQVANNVNIEEEATGSSTMNATELEMTVESSTAAPTTESVATVIREEETHVNREWIPLWQKRLITTEDPFSVHKLSAAAYTVTSFAIMGTGISRWMISRQELFAVLPGFLEPLTIVFCIANLSMCTASIRMAYLHRRNDLASRNAFVGTAGSSIFSGYFTLWASPFAPEYMTTPIASQIGFGILTAWNLLFVTDTMIRSAEIAEGRRDSTQDSENASFATEYLRYVATGVWGLPVVVLTGYILSVSHDHAWLMDVFDHIYETHGHGIQASVFYNNVLASMAAAYGSLLVMLRDKRLISKQAEWAGIAALAIPALIWTIDVTCRIVPYWTGGIEGFS